jgi:hypothetical protein
MCQCTILLFLVVKHVDKLSDRCNARSLSSFWLCVSTIALWWNGAKLTHWITVCEWSQVNRSYTLVNSFIPFHDGECFHLDMCLNFYRFGELFPCTEILNLFQFSYILNACYLIIKGTVKVSSSCASGSGCFSIRSSYWPLTKWTPYFNCEPWQGLAV